MLWRRVARLPLLVRQYSSDVPGPEDVWRRRRQFAQPHIQRDEKPNYKTWWAPEWDLTKTETSDEVYSPLRRRLMTPDKWRYQNQVGDRFGRRFLGGLARWLRRAGDRPAQAGGILPLRGEHSLLRAQDVLSLPVRLEDEGGRRDFAAQVQAEQGGQGDGRASLQGSAILADALEEAKKNAEKELTLDDPSNLFVAEAFSIQCRILKSQRRHAHENWQTVRHRYIHLFVRLEEGEPPSYKGRKPLPDGWEKMRDYYSYLRSRDFNYSL